MAKELIEQKSKALDKIVNGDNLINSTKVNSVALGNLNSATVKEGSQRRSKSADRDNYRARVGSLSVRFNSYNIGSTMLFHRLSVHVLLTCEASVNTVAHVLILSL